MTGRRIISAFVVVGSILMLASFSLGQSGFYTGKDHVVKLTTANFEQEVLKDDAIWIVKFYATWCSYCHRMVPEYKKLAKALKGVVKVGAVESEENYELCGKYDINGFPMVKIFGVNKTEPINFTQSRRAKNMAEAVVAEIQKKIQLVLDSDFQEEKEDDLPDEEVEKSEVIELEADNFDKLVFNSDEIWLVEFYGCDGKGASQEFAKAAKDLKDKNIKLGAIDIGKHKSKAVEYKLSNCPKDVKIKYFPANSKLASEATHYNGKTQAADIISWSLNKLKMPQVLQLINDESLYNACEKKTWCVISVLPSLKVCNAQCRNRMLQILSKLMQKFEKESFGWLWNVFGEQPIIEKGLQVRKSGHPTVVAVSCDRMQFSLFKGTFALDNLVKFLSEIANHRGHKMHIDCDERPAINTVKPWNGKDEETPLKADKKPKIADEL